MNSPRYFGLLAPLLFLTSSLSAQTVLSSEVGTMGSGLTAVDDAAFTPDGQKLVVRENTSRTTARIYDAKTGVLLAAYTASVGGASGIVQDAVEVTNDRAVVLGHQTQVIDLNNLQLPTMAEFDFGVWPRDVEITPDGTMAAIRGGSGMAGGLFVLDLASSSVIAQAPGEPATPGLTDVDSVATTNQHAAFISFEPSTGATRVTIMDLRPAGGGAPVIVYETGTGSDLDLVGFPHDLAITPDGTHLAVRSELSVALFDLTGAAPQMLWVKRLYGAPGPFGGSAMDSVEVSNTHIATISRWSNGGVGAQVDLFDIAGNQSYEVISGDPHDLAITPDGQKLIVRTHSRLYMYRLAPNYPGLHLHYKSRKFLPSTHTYYGAGLDSLEVTNDTAVTIARNNDTADIRLWDIRTFTLIEKAAHAMTTRPVDLEITPSGSKVVISGFGQTMVIDMLTSEELLYTQTTPVGGYPWSDGVAVNDSTAITFGAIEQACQICTPFPGWLTIIDLFEQPTVFCSSTPNSTGSIGQTYASGSASVATNNLHLVAHDLPPSTSGLFIYGDAMGNTPFGGGVLCVSGQAGFFPAQRTSPDGLAELALDSLNLPFGTPPIVMGTSRFFQYLFRDPAAGPSQTNSTSGLEVQFTL